MFGLPQREIVTVTTNVPGPRQPLYWMGRRLEEIIPYVPIASRVRTSISIFSYDGDMTFGITGDYAANPDLDVLAQGIEHGMSGTLWPQPGAGGKLRLTWLDWRARGPATGLLPRRGQGTRRFPRSAGQGVPTVRRMCGCG